MFAVEKKAAIDFQEIYEACLMCGSCYQDSKVIKELYGSNLPLGHDDNTKITYFLIADSNKKTQTGIYIFSSN